MTKLEYGKGYDLEMWRKRSKERTDITGHLTHLTRIPRDNSEPLNVVIKRGVDILIKILKERKIIGSNPSQGFIVGNNPAVCFQEAPLYGVCQNIYHEQENRQALGGKNRYDALGLSFAKRYVFEKGGRPVLYEDKDIAKKILPMEEWWRIVSFNLADEGKIIDWTHEREWRVKEDFKFELSETYVLLLNQATYRYFIEEIDKDTLKELKGIVVLQPILE
ncbi:MULTISPECIES: DUF2971 domain-containing protein [unclassified Peribacillus]|uniref:DUF2971 domain-containing protein n=1 Tax=unclassified Peribacillus TaxID=2675266 RepID=UPI001F5BA406|nr:MULTISPECIES: DUF2971 domain-containing protein [unclassified Peribacillus]WMX55653.1 DUF2971 domain-containing protein [Peribacillus sp. R9-11]